MQVSIARAKAFVTGVVSARTAVIEEGQTARGPSPRPDANRNRLLLSAEEGHNRNRLLLYVQSTHDRTRFVARYRVTRRVAVTRNAPARLCHFRSRSVSVRGQQMSSPGA